MVVFVDTSAIFAFLNQGDANHEAADRAWREILTNNVALLVNNYMVLETISLLQRRSGLEAVKDYQADIEPFLEIAWIDEKQHEKSVELHAQINKREVSLVDCSAFQTMRLLDIDTVFTFDAHFGEQGFIVIP